MKQFKEYQESRERIREEALSTNLVLNIGLHVLNDLGPRRIWWYILKSKIKVWFLGLKGDSLNDRWFIYSCLAIQIGMFGIIRPFWLALVVFTAFTTAWVLFYLWKKDLLEQAMIAGEILRANRQAKKKKRR